MTKQQAMMRCRFDVAIQNHNGSNSRFKVHTRRYNDLSNIRVAGKKKKSTWSKIEAKFSIYERKIVLDLPIRTVSEANCFEPWRKKYGRHKDQKNIVFLALNPHRDKIKLPCKIMLTRFAPDELDAFDNLPVSFKYIVDSICEIITGEHRAGKADGDRRISISCDQIKIKQYGIRIELIW